MVQRKPERKKPKDPDAVPAGGGGPGPGSRGGAGGMSPAPLPNYMRATKVGDSGPPAAPQPQPQQGRAKVALTAAAATAVPRAGRATCSSAMKGPGADGPAHACPYAYCSFKGHAHAPPLGTFVSERRRLIKTQQSMKLKGASPFRKPSTAGGRGYFVEIRAGSTTPTVTSDVSCSDISAEDAPEGLGAASVDDGSCASSDVISVGSVELLGTTEHRGREEKETLVVMVDHEGGDFCGCRSDISEELLDANHGGNIPEGGVGDAPKESSVDSISSSLSGISFEDVSSACVYEASSQKKNRSSIARRRRTSEQGVKQVRPFKPKPPNFLPAETGPEAAKVDLKHQAVDDRRTTEEWMVDYALRKEIKKLARAQKRKVEMLVQAFESVLPTVANEKKPEQHDNGDKRTFTLTWPSQACS
ncbi:calmodulin binding protein PICBP-like isoform X2 [Miscanthus floridulus]|uniref:calmodulin binding protein PICBP-like isoform X2 n=1 Tax=Miscanthus floridulus TaxID=154761 RepID=UPI00345A23EB